MKKDKRPKLRYRKGIWECYAGAGCFGYGRTIPEAWEMYINCVKKYS